jgi:hypothetical protein
LRSDAAGLAPPQEPALRHLSRDCLAHGGVRHARCAQDVPDPETGPVSGAPAESERLMRSIHYDVVVPCPVCGTPLDAARQVKGMAAPVPGDLTLCFECTSLLVFDQPPALHAMTDAELAALDEDEYEMLRFAKQHLEAFKRAH